MNRLLFYFALLAIVWTPVWQIWASPFCADVINPQVIRNQGDCGFCWLYSTAETLNSKSRMAVEDFSVDYSVAAEVVSQLNGLMELPNPSGFTFVNPRTLDGVDILGKHGSLPKDYWPYKEMSEALYRRLGYYIEAYQNVHSQGPGEKQRFLEAVVDLMKQVAPLELDGNNRIRISTAAHRGIDPHQFIRENSKIISTDYLVAMYLIHSSINILDDMRGLTKLEEGGWFEKADSLIERGGILPFWAYRLKKTLTAKDLDDIRAGVDRISADHRQKRRADPERGWGLIGESQQRIIDFLTASYINPLPQTFNIGGVTMTPQQWYKEVLGDSVAVSLRAPRIGDTLDLQPENASLLDVQTVMASRPNYSRHTLKVNSYAFPGLVKEMIDRGQTVWVGVKNWESGTTVDRTTGLVDIVPINGDFGGAHAVVIKGYNTDNGKPDGNITGFVYQNSHNSLFGDRGTGVITLRFFVRNVLSVTLWIPKAK